MIITEILIQNYKQFQGMHGFRPSPKGAIAVIGLNGAGKTTLFEAIEWCLYQPRHISSTEVAPRGSLVETTVTLSLLDVATGVDYQITRKMSKTRVASATIVHHGVIEVVKGPREVTAYVSNTLIGLSHRAFVSTFFTRQKELSFFGDMNVTERRREVGRMLGLETLRDAQKLLGELRSEAATRAKTLENQHEQQSQEVDFVALLATATSRIAEETERLVIAQRETEVAETLWNKAKGAVSTILEAERADAQARLEVQRLDADLISFQLKWDSIQQKIQDIDTSESARIEVEQEFASLQNWVEQDRVQDELRGKAVKFLNLKTEQSKLQRSIDSATAEVDRILNQDRPICPTCGQELGEDEYLKVLEGLRDQIVEATLEQDRIENQVIDLGDHEYDVNTHEKIRDSLFQAQRSEIILHNMNKLLATKPAIVQSLQPIETSVQETLLDLEKASALLESLGFSKEEADRLRDQETVASAEFHDAISAGHQLQRDIDHLETQRQNILSAQARVEALLKDAETTSKLADDLERMYKEFNVFEQFVADRVTPQLSNYTSELLSTITDGKYTRVEFNSDYGIEVYDEDAKFPISEFSGGERDVIALCARLSLSRLIGTQANNPPGFLVLDEIFGSLDQGRRGALLEVLGELGGSAEAFRQLFVISHVDDVSSGSIFSTVWEIRENESGSSELRRPDGSPRSYSMTGRHDAYGNQTTGL